jgi:hypothetical protein
MKLLTRIIVFVFFPVCFVVFQYCEKKSLPSVTTLPVSGITHINANSGGQVTNNGGAEVTSRGICWNTAESPTITSSKTTDGAGNGAFTSSMSGLTESTTYFVRAYATNSEGTSYGQQVSFSTLIKPPEADFSATPSRVPAGVRKDHPFRKERGTPLSVIQEETSGAFYGKGYQDVLVRTPSIKRMQETFGFQPKVGIKEALRRAIDFFVEEHKAMERVVETEA